MVEHIFRKSQRKNFDGWWSAVGKALWDGTVGKTEKEQKDEADKYAEIVLRSDAIHDSNFSQLKAYEQDTKKIAGEIKLEKTLPEAKKLAYIQLALSSIVSNENETWMNENLHKKYPDWRKEKLGESMNGIYLGIGYERIEKIKNSIEQVDWSSPTDFMTKVSSMMIYKTKINGQDSYGGLVGENIESLRDQGMSNEVVSRILFDAEGKSTV